jgi:hypothetical protein
MEVFAGSEQSFNIMDYGAIGGGKALNTVAIQKAIDAAAKVGGCVYVPGDTFLTGTLMLKSNMTLELAPGAVLLGSRRIEDYTPFVWGHHEDCTPWHLLVVKDAENVVICGHGTIDGQGMAFWEIERPSEWHFFREIEYRPSPMIEIWNSSHVTVTGIKICHAAGWALHFLNSQDVKVHGLSIENNLFGPNSDGIDVTGCQDVIISDCYISTGDDAIALKTTEDSESCERVAITNCILETSCVAFRIGFESRKNFRDITLSNCVVKNASRAVDLRTIEGGNIKNVLISGLVGQVNSGWSLDRVIECYAGRYDTPYKIEIPEHPNFGKPKPVEKAGTIQNVTIENVTMRTTGRLLIGASPDALIENFALRRIHLDYFLLDDPFEVGQKARSRSFFYDLPFVRTQRAVIVVEHVKNLNISDVTLNWPRYPVSSECRVLQSPHRSAFYRGREDKIRAGEIRVEFQVLAMKDVQGGKIELGELATSEGSSTIVSKINSQIIIK